MKKVKRTDQEQDYNKDPDIHSSQDFWQEIEPKMNKPSEILDFSETKKI